MPIFDRDELGRLSKKSYQSGNAREDYVFGYERSVEGKPTSIQGPQFQKAIDWDAHGRVVNESLSMKDLHLKRSMVYAADGQVVKEVLSRNGSSDVATEWLVNEGGLVEKILINGSLAVSIQYDEFGKPAELDLADQIGGGTVSLFYEPVTEKLIGFKRLLNVSGCSHEWSFDACGRIASDSWSLGEKARTCNYRYTPASMLKGVFNKNAAQTFDYGKDGRILRENAQVTYDTLGRVIEVEDRRYIYGSNNRVTRVEQNNSTLAEYIYDENGIRVAKIKKGQPNEVYFGQSVFRDNHLITPLKVAGILLGFMIDGEFESAFFDVRGSLISCEHDPFGLAKCAGSPEQESVCSFAGFGYDHDLKAVRMPTRDYMPYLREFMTPDWFLLREPDLCLEDPSQANLYCYAGNNPIQYFDPSGNFAIPFGPLAVGLQSFGYYAVIGAGVTAGLGWIAAAPYQDSLSGTSTGLLGQPPFDLSMLPRIDDYSQSGALAAPFVLGFLDLSQTDQAKSLLGSNAHVIERRKGNEDQEHGFKPKDRDQRNDTKYRAPRTGKPKDPQKKGTPENNRDQNAQTRAIRVKLRLTEKQRGELHDDISGKGYSYQEILKIAKERFSK